MTGSHLSIFCRDALICPRALQVQAGSTDGVDHREARKKLALISRVHYEKLNLLPRFEDMCLKVATSFTMSRLGISCRSI